MDAGVNFGVQVHCRGAILGSLTNAGESEGRPGGLKRGRGAWRGALGLKRDQVPKERALSDHCLSWCSASAIRAENFTIFLRIFFVSVLVHPFTFVSYMEVSTMPRELWMHHSHLVSKMFTFLRPLGFLHFAHLRSSVLRCARVLQST